jgi:hypothetical protein
VVERLCVGRRSGERNPEQYERNGYAASPHSRPPPIRLDADIRLGPAPRIRTERAHCIKT